MNCSRILALQIFAQARNLKWSVMKRRDQRR